MDFSSEPSVSHPRSTSVLSSPADNSAARVESLLRSAVVDAVVRDTHHDSEAPPRDSVLPSLDTFTTGAPVITTALGDAGARFLADAHLSGLAGVRTVTPQCIMGVVDTDVFTNFCRDALATGAETHSWSEETMTAVAYAYQDGHAIEAGLRTRETADQLPTPEWAECLGKQTQAPTPVLLPVPYDITPTTRVRDISHRPLAVAAGVEHVLSWCSTTDADVSPTDAFVVYVTGCLQAAGYDDLATYRFFIDECEYNPGRVSDAYDRVRRAVTPDTVPGPDTVYEAYLSPAELTEITDIILSSS